MKAAVQPPTTASEIQFMLSVQREAYQFDRMGEWIEQADIVEHRAALLHPPQRIERGGGKEHRKDHKVHHAGEILELLDAGGDQHAERAEHQPGQDQRRQHREIADRRRRDIPEPRDQQEGIDLEQRDRGSREKLAEQQIPARQRAHQQVRMLPISRS
jgi:hypothetical protein